MKKTILIVTIITALLLTGCGSKKTDDGIELFEYIHEYLIQDEFDYAQYSEGLEDYIDYMLFSDEPRGFDREKFDKEILEEIFEAYVKGVHMNSGISARDFYTDEEKNLDDEAIEKVIEEIEGDLKISIGDKGELIASSRDSEEALGFLEYDDVEVKSEHYGSLYRQSYLGSDGSESGQLLIWYDDIFIVETTNSSGEVTTYVYSVIIQLNYDEESQKIFGISVSDNKVEIEKSEIDNYLKAAVEISEPGRWFND